MPTTAAPMDDLRNFGVLLKDNARLYTKLYERLSGELGITFPKAKVLGFLFRNEGITQARLAEVTETDPMTLVRILDRMEKDGWIERRPDASDRRVRRLYVRAPALPILNSIDSLAARARGVALARLSAADRRRTVELLEQIHQNLVLQEQDAAAAPVRKAAKKRPPARRPRSVA